MRILIVGSAAPAALERIYESRLKEAGAEPLLFDVRQTLGRIHRLPRKWISVIRRFFPSTGLGPVNQLLMNTVAEFKPAVVWIFKGMEILPATLVKMRAMGPLLVNFNPDHPFSFTGPGSGNALVTRGLPLYDAHLTYHTGVARLLKEKFGAKVGMLPFGFDLDEADYLDLEQEEEIVRACFVGSADAERAAFVGHLRQKGVCVDVFGSGWNQWPNPLSMGEAHGPVYGLEFWRTLRKYRVQLNIFRPHNVGSHNMRSFDVAGVGGIQLAPESEEHLRFFENQKEAVFFSTPDDAASKALEMLAWDPAVARNMRENARRRSVNAKYAYFDRANQALGFFRQWLSDK